MIITNSQASSAVSDLMQAIFAASPAIFTVIVALAALGLVVALIDRVVRSLVGGGSRD